MTNARNFQVTTFPRPNPVCADSARLRPPLLPSRTSFQGLIQTLLSGYNALRRVFVRPAPSNSSLTELQEIRARASHPNDINEHLEAMFVESLLLQPKLIVELGVRSGVSTFIFERA